MNIKQKRMAAALAAVGQYLEEEAAAFAAQAMVVPPRLAAEPGLWAQAGHIEAMAARRMMQMRTLARIA